MNSRPLLFVLLAMLTGCVAPKDAAVVKRPPARALHVTSDVSFEVWNQVYSVMASATVILPAGTYSLQSQGKDGDYYAAPSALKVSSGDSAVLNPVGGIFWKAGRPHPDQYYVRKHTGELHAFPRRSSEIRRSYLSGNIKAQ